MTTPLEQEVSRLKEQLIEWRRDFHRHPEIAYQEQRTSSVLRGFLENLGLPVRNLAKTGLRAELKGGSPGKTVALRADMDALPVQEESGKEYASENPGAMHACGHDGHMAILMGVAKLLSGRREELKGSVVFLFQPSEERHPGGAKPMIEEGALDGVDAVFGLHLWQSFPTGKVGILPGPMMAQSDEFSITVQGKGGHGSMPHQTVDPILVASQIVVNMQSIVSRNVDPLKSAVVSFGEVAGGSAHNIIPEKVVLTGTVRTFEETLQKMIKQRVFEIAEGTARVFGALADVRYTDGYPPLVNDAEMVEFVKQVVISTLGPEALPEFAPVMGGEDFAYYLQKVPGAFFFLGSGTGCPYPHHHPKFDIDEEALPIGTLLLSKIALEFLSRN